MWPNEPFSPRPPLCALSRARQGSRQSLEPALATRLFFLSPPLSLKQGGGERHEIALIAGDPRQPLGLACSQAELGDARARQGRFGNPARCSAATSIASSSSPGVMQQVHECLGGRGKGRSSPSSSGGQFPSEVGDRLRRRPGPGVLSDRSRDRRRSSRTAEVRRRASAARAAGHTRSGRRPASSTSRVSHQERHPHHGRQVRDIDVVGFVGEEPGAVFEQLGDGTFPPAAAPGPGWRSRSGGSRSARGAGGGSDGLRSAARVASSCGGNCSKAVIAGQVP